MGVRISDEGSTRRLWHAGFTRARQHSRCSILGRWLDRFVGRPLAFRRHRLRSYIKRIPERLVEIQQWSVDVDFRLPTSESARQLRCSRKSRLGQHSRLATGSNQLDRSVRDFLALRREWHGFRRGHWIAERYVEVQQRKMDLDVRVQINQSSRRLRHAKHALPRKYSWRSY